MSPVSLWPGRSRRGSRSLHFRHHHAFDLGLHLGIYGMLALMYSITSVPDSLSTPDTSNRPGPSPTTAGKPCGVGGGGRPGGSYVLSYSSQRRAGGFWGRKEHRSGGANAGGLTIRSRTQGAVAHER
jgi:hypothetical protein